ncbi:unnamed protein product [Urochloa humidicola]
MSPASRCSLQDLRRRSSGGGDFEMRRDTKNPTLASTITRSACPMAAAWEIKGSKGQLVKVKPHVMKELSSAVQSLGRQCTALRRFPLTLVHPVKRS